MSEIKQTYQQLEQELEVWRHGPSCWSCGDSGDVHHLDGEWLGRCDCLAAQLIEVKAENERLKGLQPGYPPRPPDGDGLPRYGLRWNGPQQPLAVPMTDGYWTPWHLADQFKVENEQLREANDKLTRRNGMLEENVQTLSDTHVLYTWLRKKVDQPSNDVVAVQMNIGHDWVPVHDLDRDLRTMIDQEVP